MRSKETLRRVGWFLVFLLMAHGNTSLGLLVLAVASLIALRGGRWRAAPDRLTRGLFLTLLAAMAVSAVLSPAKLVAGPLTFGYALLVFVLVFGAEWLVVEESYLRRVLLPALVAGSLVSFAYAILRYLIVRPERAEALFTSFNGLGTLIVLATGVSLGYLLGLAGRRRYLALPYLSVAIVALLLTFSRGAWLGFLVMLGTLGLVNRGARRWAVLGILGVAIGLAFVPQLAHRFLTSFDLSANAPRLYIWRAALDMIQAHPIFGVGAGVFMHVYPQYVLPGAPEPVAAFAHNLFLQVAAEFGLVGLAIFLAILGRVMWQAWRLARTGNVFYQGIFAALVGVLIHQQVDIPIWGLEIGGAFWTLVGLVIALHRRQS